jgi:thiamine pyrophosphate-dependent acetolactate synthase large subunit-like protein
MVGVAPTTPGLSGTKPDFVALAHGFGMRGTKAETPEALRTALEESFATPGPSHDMVAHRKKGRYMNTATTHTDSKAVL